MSNGVLAEIRRWKTGGAPSPTLLPDRTRAERWAAQILADRPNVESLQFVVTSEFDKDCLYALVEIVSLRKRHGNPSSSEDHRLATTVLDSAIWRADRLDERGQLARRLARLARPSDRKARSHLALQRMESPATLDGKPLAAVNATDIAIRPDVVLSDKYVFAEKESPEAVTSPLPEKLAATCSLLTKRIDTSPADVFTTAQAIYDHLQRGENAGRFRIGERESYMGELAMLAGGACRILHRHDDAITWLDRSRSWFLSVSSSELDLARVEYQRLALCLEKRKSLEVLEMAKPLEAIFVRAGLEDFALKSRYLQGMALRELGRSDEALEIFERVLAAAENLGARLLGHTLVMLVQIHSDLGNTEEAARLVREAEPILRSDGNLVALGKLYWGIGLLLRADGRVAESIRAFRVAQHELSKIQLRADVAALHLLIADILLESGQNRRAEWEIRAALPIIGEQKMIPEGIAAVSMLRDSIRLRSIDRRALRTLQNCLVNGQS